MIPFPDNDAIEKGRALHDKIKSHPFRLEPQLALLDEFHELIEGIHWSLKANWENDFWRKKYLGKYIETTEVLLQLLHKLIDGETVAEASLPTERIHYNKEDDYTHYKYVRSPYYDNDWVLESTHRRKENEKLTGEVVEK